MDNLFLILLLASLTLFVIGFFRPTTSLFWYKKTQTKKKSAIVYGALIIVCFILFGITTDTEQNLAASKNPVSTTENVIKGVPNYKNIDSLKPAFSSPPFNYTFNNENAFSDTNVAIKGFESPDITDATTNNNIVLQFDPKTKEIYLASLTIIVDNYNIKPLQVEQIFKFAGFFDPNSEKYFREHFRDIFYNNKTYLDSSGYTSEQKGLDLVINHNLLEAKELVQREGESSLVGHSLDVTIEVSNKVKAKSLFNQLLIILFSKKSYR